MVTLTLGQQPCEAKSNEIEAIKELLPVLALEGAVVTIDAIGCQTAIASQIVEGGGAYVLAVKDNQPTLATALREFFACLNQPGYPLRPCDTHETVDKGHGRFETRRCTAVDDLAWLDAIELRARWPNLRSVACIESQRETHGQVQTETRYVSVRCQPTPSAFCMSLAPTGLSRMACTGAWMSPSVRTPARSGYATPR